MKIYTRSGDDGTTGLFGGQRVSKSDRRIQCCGAIDELNAAIGLAIVAAPDIIARQLLPLQPELLAIGAHAGTPPDSPSQTQLPLLDPRMIQRLEVEIDAAEAPLPPLRNFILPGGCESAGRLHLARTICRRGERLLVELNQHQVLAAPILPYFNRLGDWLFVMARLANRLAGVEEGVWKTNNPAAPAPAT